MQKPTLETIKDAVMQHGCYSPEENERLYQKWFSKGPRRRTLAAIKRHGLDKMRTVDVGSGLETTFCISEKARTE